MNELSHFSQEEQKKIISYYILAYTENTAFSPEYLKEKFSTIDIKNIEQAFEINLPDRSLDIGFDINLFR